MCMKIVYKMVDEGNKKMLKTESREVTGAQQTFFILTAAPLIKAASAPAFSKGLDMLTARCVNTNIRHWQHQYQQTWLMNKTLPALQ